MSDDLKMDGVTLTLKECEEVLRWVEEPWTVRPACMIWGCADRPAIPRSNGDYYVDLTPDVIERIRDHATPWTEVRRDEVKPGMRVRVVAATGVLIGEGLVTDYYASGDQLVVRSDGSVCDGSVFTLYTAYTAGRQAYFVRRPRKRTLTLGEVEPGAVVMLEGFRHRVLCDYTTASDRIRAARLDTWESHLWPLDTPVTLVEDE